MLKKVLVAHLLLMFTSSCQQSQHPKNQKYKPNILLILADDVGQEVLGSYGGTSYTTTHLNQLALSGLRFDHAYSMPVCHTSRLCLITGQYPFRLENPSWGTFPKSWEQRTLPNLLKKAGYATAIAGKWQLALLKDDVEHPFRLGFDEYSLFGWHEGPRYYSPLIWENGKIRSNTTNHYGPDIYVEFLINFMKRNLNQPFFAYYSMALCHDVTDDLKEPVPFGPHGRYDSYTEMVEAMDNRIGQLVTALDQLGLREKTLIFFTADNGTPKRSILSVKNGRFIRKQIVSQFGEVPINGGKGELTDAGTRVPTIANWQGVLPGDNVTQELMDLSDLLPTFAELAGAEIPWKTSLDGKSLAGILTDKPGRGRDWVFSEHRSHSWVRTREWKLYQNGQLFNMITDPSEKYPVPEDWNPLSSSIPRNELKAIFNKLYSKKN